MYENYIFDLYGTLVDIHTEESGMGVWRRLSLFYGFYNAHYTPVELKNAYFDAVKKGLETVKNDLSANYAHESYPELQIEYVFKELFAQKGVDAPIELAIMAGQLFRIETIKHLKLYPGVNKLLAKIKEAGKKVYLLSNAQRIFTEYEMNALGITEYFDGILISSDEKVKKPDESFFALLKARFDVDFSKSIMIGNDSKCDIEGAKSVGMDTAYIRSNISPADDPKPDATYVFQRMNISELAQTLGFKI